MHMKETHKKGAHHRSGQCWQQTCYLEKGESNVVHGPSGLESFDSSGLERTRAYWRLEPSRVQVRTGLESSSPLEPRAGLGESRCYRSKGT